jgi:hypothetical protein
MIRFVLLLFFLMPFKSYACFHINTESFKAETRDVFVEILGLFEMLESILQDTITYYGAEAERFKKKHTDSLLKAIFPKEKKLPPYFKNKIDYHKQFFLNDLKSVRRFKKYLEHYLIKGDFQAVNNAYSHNPKITDFKAIEYLYKKYKKLFSKLHEKEPKIENDLIMTSFLISFIEKINEYIEILKLNVNRELLSSVDDKEKLIHDGLLIVYNNSPIYKQDETYNYINDKLIELLQNLTLMGELINRSNLCQKIEVDQIIPMPIRQRQSKEPIIKLIPVPSEINVLLTKEERKEYDHLLQVTDNIQLITQLEDIQKDILHISPNEQVEEIEEDRWWTKIKVEKLYREQKIYLKDTIQRLSVIPKIYTEEEKIDIILTNRSNDLLEQILRPGRHHLKELNWQKVQTFLEGLGAYVEKHSRGYFVTLNREKTCFHAHGKIYEDTINTHLKGFLIDALFKN